MSVYVPTKLRWFSVCTLKTQNLTHRFCAARPRRGEEVIFPFPSWKYFLACCLQSMDLLWRSASPFHPLLVGVLQSPLVGVLLSLLVGVLLSLLWMLLKLLLDLWGFMPLVSFIPLNPPIFLFHCIQLSLPPSISFSLPHPLHTNILPMVLVLCFTTKIFSSLLNLLHHVVAFVS